MRNIQNKIQITVLKATLNKGGEWESQKRKYSNLENYFLKLFSNNLTKT